MTSAALGREALTVGTAGQTRQRQDRHHPLLRALGAPAEIASHGSRIPHPYRRDGATTALHQAHSGVGLHAERDQAAPRPPPHPWRDVCRCPKPRRSEDESSAPNQTECPAISCGNTGCVCGGGLPFRGVSRLLASGWWTHLRAGIDFVSGVGCLLLAIAPLASQARHHLQPFILGLIASAFVLVGRFLLNAPAATVAGIAVLVAAYVWSYRPRRAASACCSSCATPPSSTGEATEAEDNPIACALDKAQFEERKALVDRLAQRATERKVIPNGFALRFGRDSGLVSQLASFIEVERACCPFLTFRIDVRAGASVWLELTGPAAAQEIIRELIPTA